VPDSKPTSALPPPLALLRDTPAGAIYALAAKNELLEGVEACQHRAVAGAEWRDDRRVLTLELAAGPQVSFSATGPQLQIECSCRKWSPGRHCSHVVTGWALLKRVVSPESLAASRFSDRLLRDVEILVGLREGEVPSAPKKPSLADRLAEARRIRAVKLAARAKAAKPAKVTATKPDKSDIRLVLEIGWP